MGTELFIRCRSVRQSHSLRRSAPACSSRQLVHVHMLRPPAGPGAPQAFDADGSGTITVQQMEQALRKQGSVVEQEELDHLVAALDADRSGGAARPHAIP